jgi:hypothetical protein
VVANAKLKLKRFDMWKWFLGLFRGECSANKTEKDMVLAHIEYHGSISTTEARIIGINHLRSVICKMRKDGYKIKNVSNAGSIGIYKF